MRAAIKNPYWDTLGGGERYAISFGQVLLDAGYSVDVEWKSGEILEKVGKRFGISTKNLNVIKDVKRGDGYDVCFWVSDGSVPTLRARRNFLHFQMPFTSVNGRSLINKMKLYRVEKIISNSNFTKKIIDKEYGVKSIVVYPPTNVGDIEPKKKENIILYVGRFSQLAQIKGQDVLIDCFKSFVNKGFDSYRLVLAGGAEVGSDKYLSKLKRKSGNYKVIFEENISYQRLLSYYSRAKIFWSASGFGINENKEPKKVEHFGITVVEAMAGGAVPIIYNAGGHKEIVKEAESGFLWSTKGELVKKTIGLIKGKDYEKISQKANHSAEKFSYENFKTKISSLL